MFTLISLDYILLFLAPMQVETWHLFLNIPTESNHKLAPTLDLGDRLALEGDYWVGVHPGFRVTQAQLALLVSAPTPHDALFVDCHTDGAAQLDVNDLVRDGPDLLGRLKLVKMIFMTPEIQFTIASHSSRMSACCYFDNEFILERCDHDWCIANNLMIRHSQLVLLIGATCQHLALLSQEQGVVGASTDLPDPVFIQ
jgi:hypothetical protein